MVYKLICMCEFSLTFLGMTFVAGFHLFIFLPLWTHLFNIQTHLINKHQSDSVSGTNDAIGNS